MFPHMEIQVVRDVLEANQGHIENTVDCLLDINYPEPENDEGFAQQIAVAESIQDSRSYVLQWYGIIWIIFEYLPDEWNVDERGGGIFRKEGVEPVLEVMKMNIPYDNGGIGILKKRRVDTYYTDEY